MRTLPNKLPRPNERVLVDGMSKKKWSTYLREKAPACDAVWLYNPRQYLGRDPESMLKTLPPDFVLIPQRTANEMFPNDAGWALDALQIWGRAYDLEVMEMSQAKALEALQNNRAFAELEGKVVFMTATFSEQLSTYGFLLTYADFCTVDEIQRTATAC